MYDGTASRLHRGPPCPRPLPKPKKAKATADKH